MFNTKKAKNNYFSGYVFLYLPPYYLNLQCLKIKPIYPWTSNLQDSTVITEVCVYNGAQYAQGQTWRDGCTYDCSCDDADQGKYTCTDV